MEASAFSRCRALLLVSPHGAYVRWRHGNRRLSVFGGDNVRLDLAVHSPPPETLGDRLRRGVGCFAESRIVARLDLVPQGCPLAVRDCWHTRGFRPTARRNRRDLG